MMVLSMIKIVKFTINHLWKQSYARMYEGYINDHELDQTNNLQQSKWMRILESKMPKLALLRAIGIWNLILFSTNYMVAASLYQTPIEIEVDETARKAYLPKYNRWRRIRDRFKAVTTLISTKIDELSRNTAPIRRSTQSYRHGNFHRRRKSKSIAAMAAVLMVASAQSRQVVHQSAQFDTDSKPIGIDNRCSACISHDIKDFIGPLKESDRTIKGFGGIRHTSQIMVGTIKWKWSDDQGKVHKHIIPNSYYVPKGNCRLLSPQHWAKEKRGKSKITTGEFTNSQHSILQWGEGGKYKRTVPLCPSTNVATLYMAPGYRNYDIYCKEAKLIPTEEDANPHTLSSQDAEEGKTCKIAFNPLSHRVEWTSSSNDDKPREFDLNGPSSSKATKQHSDTLNMSFEARDMLKLHYKLGHMPFAKMREMARQGHIPKQFAKCDVPLCSACIYAKQTRKPWRNKPLKQREVDDHQLEPGEVVSVDQMVSPTPGLIAQMTGILTNKRYRYATVYVDQATRLGYVYLQKSADARNN